MELSAQLSTALQRSLWDSPRDAINTGLIRMTSALMTGWRSRETDTWLLLAIASLLCDR